VDEATAKKYVEDISKSIAEYGWFCQGVQGDGKDPDWCYTIGLTRSYRHPELCIFGLKTESRLQILANIVGVIKEGKTFKAGDEVIDIVKKYSLAFRDVPLATYEKYFGVGVRFNNWQSFEMLQVFWPDHAGLFPWEDGFEEGFRYAQPQLWRD